MQLTSICHEPYWVYKCLQSRTTRIVIHHALCAHCNNGKGLHANGEDWIGCPTLDFAERFATVIAKLMGGEVHYCKHCLYLSELTTR